MKKIVKITNEFAKKTGLDESYVGKTIKRVEEFNEDVEVDDKYVIARVSAISPDADGDVILPTAFDLTRYKINPVILKNHDHANPIGYVENISVGKREIIAKVKFGSTQECQDVYQLYKDKVRRGFSVGFIPLEEVTKGSREYRDIMDMLEKDMPDIFNQKNAHLVDKIVTRAELIEISCVAIPNNAHALALTVKNVETDIKESFIETVQAEKAIVQPQEVQVKEPKEEEPKPIVIKKLNESAVKIKKVGNIHDDFVKENYLKMGGL